MNNLAIFCMLLINLWIICDKTYRYVTKRIVIATKCIVVATKRIVIATKRIVIGL